ncbi:MAG: peptide ABC transporter substrate-binding protein [Ruminococcus sp.]|nr:peptide ABC transporter substrate-binding protein [Ruminococcus sp.]
MSLAYFDKKEIKLKKITAFFCAALLAFPLYSCGKDDKGSGANHLYDVPLSGNPKSLDPQFANDPSSNTVIKNLYSGLVSTDENGNIVCCNAQSYTVSPDQLTYTFSLRQDNYWFFDKNDNDEIDENEYFPVTADDYVFALQRVLDPKMQSPYASNFMCIQNGSSIINGKTDPLNAGISAIDDFTLEITLDYPSAEFLGMLSTAAAFPCNREFFDSTKGRYGLDDTSVMSNGPFYVRQWFFDPYGSHNILYMRRNEINANETFQILPSYVSFTIQESDSDIRELFKDGKIECFSTLYNSYNKNKYSVKSSPAITLGLVFNPDDKIFSNNNLRKALAYSIDRNMLSSQIGDDSQIAAGIIPPAVKLAGRSYRELSADSQFGVYDINEAQKCLQAAKKELNIGSVESVKILVNAETADSGDLHLLSQSWQDTLGIYIGIEDVTAEEFDRRIAEGDYTIALYPLKGDLCSGLSVIGQFEKNDCLKEAAGKALFTEAILKCGDISSLVEEYTNAEKTIIGGFGFIPIFYKNAYLVSSSDNESLIYDPFTEAIDYRLAQNFS